MKLSPNQQRLFRQLLAALPEKAGVFLVGGTVRDALLRRPTNDADIVVTNLAAPTLKKHLAKLGKVEFVGARFGVFKVFPKNSSLHLDVALPRTEAARGTGGKRDFVFTSDAHLPIETDLARRDFTVNAMAFDLRTRQLIDPFGGQKDLKNKLLRAVGKPALRFQEDYSRLLRLLRFAAQLGFRVEPATAAAAKKLMPRINQQRDGDFVVAREVVAEQLVRAFQAGAVDAFDLYDRFGAFQALLPEVAAMKGSTQSRQFHAEGDVFTHTRLLLQLLKKPLSMNVVFAALLHDVGKPSTRKVMMKKGKRVIRFIEHVSKGVNMADDIAQRLKLSSYQGLVSTERLVFLVKQHHLADPAVARSMKPLTLVKYFAGEQGQELLQLIWADQSASRGPDGKPNLAAYHFLRRRLKKLFGPSMQLPPPLVTGTEIMQWFRLPEGPFIGELLRRVQEAQLMKTVRTKTEARRFLKPLAKQRHD